MQEAFKIGDKVIIKGEEHPIVYVIYNIDVDLVYVKGYKYRVCKQVNIELIRLASLKEIKIEDEIDNKYYFKVQNFKNRQPRRYVLGKVLHVDGDDSYLNKCLELYKRVGVYAFGVTCDEENMQYEVAKYVREINPDIVVITGHDLFNNKEVKDLNNYVNSKNFIETIKEIRRVNNKVVIIAGACQSNFEALIASGADFASSPKRINIHTFDPAVVAIKAATTSFLKVVNLDDVYKYIENGSDAFGGLETLGKMRLLL